MCRYIMGKTPNLYVLFNEWQIHNSNHCPVAWTNLFHDMIIAMAWPPRGMDNVYQIFYDLVDRMVYR